MDSNSLAAIMRRLLLHGHFVSLLDDNLGRKLGRMNRWALDPFFALPLTRTLAIALPRELDIRRLRELGLGAVDRAGGALLLERLANLRWQPLEVVREDAELLPSA